MVAVHPDAAAEVNPDLILSIAAHAEAYSDHPIAVSVKEAFTGEIDQSRIADVREEGGHGVRAVVDERVVLVGNDKLMCEEGIAYHDCELTGTILHVSIDGKYAGHIIIADVVKEDAAECIKRLHAAGVKKTVMLTGDRAEVAKAVAEKLGLDEYHGKLLPEDKVNQVERLLGETSEKGKLAFVGDGINDSPALSCADVSVSMKDSSDIAREVADISLLSSSLAELVVLRELSCAVLEKIERNYRFIIGFNSSLILLGMFGLITPDLSAFLHNASTVYVSARSTRRCLPPVRVPK